MLPKQAVTGVHEKTLTQTFTTKVLSTTLDSDIPGQGEALTATDSAPLLPHFTFSCHGAVSRF